MINAAAIMLLVLSPVLLPAIITVFHAIANWRRRDTPRRVAVEDRTRMIVVE